MSATGLNLSRLLEQQGCNQREHQHDAEQKEGVAEGHDIGLQPDPGADGDDRLVPGRRRIGDAVIEEIGRQLIDPIRVASSNSDTELLSTLE